MENTLEQKVVKFFRLSVRWLMPFVVACYGLYGYSLNTKYSEIGSFLIRYVAPVLLLPVVGSLLVWYFLQVWNGITGRSMLSGKLNRQPFIFFGVLAFLFLGAICVAIIAFIFYSFSL